MPRNLVLPHRAGKRGGVGCQGVVARRSAWPGSPHPRREDAKRLPTELGLAAPHGPGGRTTAVTPGTFCKHSQECGGTCGSTSEASPAHRPDVTEKRPPRGSRREGSAPCVPATSLRPVTALGRSSYGSCLAACTALQRSAPSCPVIFPRAPA